MVPELAAILATDAYDTLPEPIKAVYSKSEFLWLSDQQKQHLIQTETEPDWNE